MLWSDLFFGKRNKGWGFSRQISLWRPPAHSRSVRNSQGVVKKKKKNKVPPPLLCWCCYNSANWGTNEPQIETMRRVKDPCFPDKANDQIGGALRKGGGESLTSQSGGTQLAPSDTASDHPVRYWNDERSNKDKHPFTVMLKGCALHALLKGLPFL